MNIQMTTGADSWFAERFRRAGVQPDSTSAAPLAAWPNIFKLGAVSVAGSVSLSLDHSQKNMKVNLMDDRATVFLFLLKVVFGLSCGKFNKCWVSHIKGCVTVVII